MIERSPTAKLSAGREVFLDARAKAWSRVFEDFHRTVLTEKCSSQDEYKHPEKESHFKSHRRILLVFDVEAAEARVEIAKSTVDEVCDLLLEDERD